MSQGRPKKSTTASILGAGLGGLVELSGTHPLDTVTRRLQNNKSKIFDTKPLTTIDNFYKVALGPGKMYSGFTVGLLDRVGKRALKLGGQPLVLQGLEENYGAYFAAHFGKKSKIAMEMTAGAGMGGVEVILLPFDNLKINMQINPQAFGNKQLMQVAYEQGFNLYKGAALTASRNMPGSGLLFGGSAAYLYLAGVDDKNTTMVQGFAASACGSAASVGGTLPLDVVKTRVQKASVGPHPKNGRTIAYEMIKLEGWSSFFKGNLPKLGSSMVKMTIGMTAAKEIQKALDRQLSPEDSDRPSKKLGKS